MLAQEAAAAKRAEEERLEAERIRAEAAAVQKAADDARRAATVGHAQASGLHHGGWC